MAILWNRNNRRAGWQRRIKRENISWFVGWVFITRGRRGWRPFCNWYVWQCSLLPPPPRRSPHSLSVSVSLFSHTHTHTHTQTRGCVRVSHAKALVWWLWSPISLSLSALCSLSHTQTHTTHTLFTHTTYTYTHSSHIHTHSSHTHTHTQRRERKGGEMNAERMLFAEGTSFQVEPAVQHLPSLRAKINTWHSS